MIARNKKIYGENIYTSFGDKIIGGDTKVNQGRKEESMENKNLAEATRRLHIKQEVSWDTRRE